MAERPIGNRGSEHENQQRFHTFLLIGCTDNPSAGDVGTDADCG